MNTVVQWEYEITTTLPTKSALKKRGLDGWELAAIAATKNGGHECYWKRRRD